MVLNIRGVAKLSVIAFGLMQAAAVGPTTYFFSIQLVKCTTCQSMEANSICLCCCNV